MIYVINENGSGLRSLNAPVDFQEGIEWSPDGSKIAYIYKRNLHVMNVDGSDQLLLFENIYRGNHSAYSFSKDSGQIIFIHESKQIYSINTDGTGLESIGSQMSNFDRFRLSPDVSKIAFIASADSRAEIFIMNLDGTGNERLTFTDSETYFFLDHLQWSPDGAYIAFFQFFAPPIDDTRWILNTLKIDSKIQAVLAKGSNIDRSISWSVR